MLTYLSEKCFEIEAYGSTEIGIPKSESELRFRIRNQSRNSDVEIETEIESLISTSKPKSRFWHRNFDEFIMKFCRN
jgi:hypothetical protein